MIVVKHHFIGGIYTKELVIKDGATEVSHQHNFDHQSILAQGCAIVEVGGVKSTYWSPAIIEIKAGLNHSVTAVNGDVIWYCQHATDCTDPEQIDHTLIMANEHG
jgi:hypothetical protein